MRAGHFAAAAQQLIKHAAVKRPGPMFIGIGQGGNALGASGSPRCRSLPSLAARPPQISRRDCARPDEQNNMATNWPQQLNPRSWRSARCSTTARSNSVRENNCNIWLKMMDTRITAALALPMVHVSQTQTVAEFYRRRSKANLDKSDSC